MCFKLYTFYPFLYHQYSQRNYFLNILFWSRVHAMHLRRSAFMRLDCINTHKSFFKNALIFRGTAKRLGVKIFVRSRIILVGAILTEL